MQEPAYIQRTLSMHYGEAACIPLTEETHPDIFYKIKELSQKIGLPVPHIYQVHDTQGGKIEAEGLWEYNLIAVGQGFLSKLTKAQQLAAILHEWGHLGSPPPFLSEYGCEHNPSLQEAYIKQESAADAFAAVFVGKETMISLLELIIADRKETAAQHGKTFENEWMYKVFRQRIDNLNQAKFLSLNTGAGTSSKGIA